ncbi:MAG: transketolase [Fastidiosipilaceae bacterium]|nr:transketolase [Clostridiaceae bacterium]
MKNTDVSELKKIANELRQSVIKMVYQAQSGHPGGSLSAAEIVTALYFREMNIDPQNPKWEDRDRFVLSKGHACPIQYAALAKRGYFDESELSTLRKEGSILQGHPDMKKTPGIDISTGSLGLGFPSATGMAIAAKRDGKDYRVFVVLGDGECQEGIVWEGAQVANKYQLDNLVIFVDNNNLQIDGTCDEVMPNIDLGKKFAAFGFEVYEINGNDMEQVVDVLDRIAEKRDSGKPKCIFADTVKGQGVSYMENQCDWHGKAPNTELYEQAMRELGGTL